MNTLKEISVSQAKAIYQDGSYIDNDLILFDQFEDVPLPTENRRMNCMFVALCIEGKAQYTVDTKEYKVKANDIMIINQGQVVGDYLLSRDCKGIAFMASNEFINEIVKGIQELSSLFLFTRTNPIVRLTKEDTNTFTYYFNLIKHKVDDKKHHYRKELASSLFLAMLYDLSNEIWQLQHIDHHQTRAEFIFANFVKLVEANFRKERRVSWYGQQLCITPKYLSETVKQVSHQTPNEWIDRYVTLEIRVQLKNTNKSIKEIAQDLNFPNQSFLGKYFKEHVGISPSDYRKS